MPRPATKDDLISLANGNFIKLFDLIESMGTEEQEMKFNFEDRDKNTFLRVACFAFKFHQIKSKFKRDKAVFTAFLQLANISEDEY